MDKNKNMFTSWALKLGFLEYMNGWGLAYILICTYVPVLCATCVILTSKGWIASLTQPKEKTYIPYNLVEF